MDTKLAALLTFVIFPALVGTTTFTILTTIEDAQATGGGEVIELVIPIIDETTQAVQNNDTQKALTLLDEIKTELKDTFFAEEDEQEDDKKDKKKKNKD
jgi:short-subunit dehydrogenase involved in D-alanine esterification of teichoic acids